MPKWKVEVTRISYRTKTFEVEANEAWAAEEMAIEMAHNTDYKDVPEKHSDYDMDLPAQLVEENTKQDPTPLTDAGWTATKDRPPLARDHARNERLKGKE